MPVTNGDIRIRLSTEQKQELRRKAAASGKTMSAYTRERVLSNDLELYLMVKRIYDVLCLQNADKIIKEGNQEIIIRTLKKTRLRL